MGVKKNLTVAGLSALLAVPALGVSKMGHIQIPGITTARVHASQYHKVTLPRAYWGNWYASHDYGPESSGNGRSTYAPYYVKLGPNGGYYRSSKDDQGPTTITNTDSESRKDGYKYSAWAGPVGRSQGSGFVLLNNNTLKYNEDASNWLLHRVPNSVDPESNNEDSGDDTNYNDGSLINTATNNINSVDGTNNYIGEQSNNRKKLAQTNEVDHQTSAIVTSMILGATSIGLGAMEMKKRKRN